MENQGIGITFVGAALIALAVVAAMLLVRHFKADSTQANQH